MAYIYLNNTIDHSQILKSYFIFRSNCSEGQPRPFQFGSWVSKEQCFYILFKTLFFFFLRKFVVDFSACPLDTDTIQG